MTTPTDPMKESEEARAEAREILTQYWGKTFSEQGEAQQWLTDYLSKRLDLYKQREKEAQKWMEHLSTCPKIHPSLKIRETWECSCGLDAFLAKVK
jgi:hypothetical protein